MEPDFQRDIGPYDNAGKALRQYAATGFNLEYVGNEQLCGMVIREGWVMSGVRASPFEMEYLNAYLHEHYDPVFAQLVQAWIIRAHLAGIEKGQNKF